MSSRRREVPWLPLGMVALGGLLLLGAAIWMLWPGLGKSQINPPASQEATLTVAEVPRVSLADAKAAFDTGSAIFVDVRTAEAYAHAHIPGALSIPLSELPQRLEELEPSAWIITY